MPRHRFIPTFCLAVLVWASAALSQEMTIEPVVGPAAGLLSVRWNGGESAAATVDILLSVDGGATFPHALATGRPNNGQALVMLPDVATASARLKVQPTGTDSSATSPEDFEIRRLQKAVMLVRHADKATSPADNPPLSDKGRERARRLGELLAPNPPAVIFSTKTRRTRETAKRVADASDADAPVKTYAPLDVSDLQSQREALQEGQWILVVGHSNTLHQLVERLGGPAAGANVIDEAEYDHILLLTGDNTVRPGRY